MAANMARPGMNPLQWLNANQNNNNKQNILQVSSLVGLTAMVVGYFFLSSGSLPERPQTPYPQQDLVDLHDDLFLAHGDKLQQHLNKLESTEMATDYKDIQSARQVVDETSGKYDKVENKIKYFSSKLNEQEKLKSSLRNVLQSSQQHIDFITGQKLSQKELVEALNQAPGSLDDLHKQLDQVKRSQEEVRTRMDSRIELEKTNRHKTSELREELKSASLHLQAMERKLRTHLRLVKSTEKSLDKIRKNRAEHTRKGSTNGAELRQLELKKISTESEGETLKMELDALEAERWINDEQKQLRVSALELLESLSLGEDLALTKASREKKLSELLSDLSQLKAKGPSNLKVEPSKVGNSDSLKKVGYFAQLAHNKKLTELENNIAALKAEIQFIDDFGAEDPKHVRESLTQEIQAFDVKLARLSSREGQVEARVEDIKSRMTKVEAEIKQKREFRDNANSQSAQYAVSEHQLESTLRGHHDNSNLVEANIDKAREAESIAQRNLDNHLAVKLEDNTASLNQEKLKLDDDHIALHKQIVALLGEHEKLLAKSQATEIQIQNSKTKFHSVLGKIRALNVEHDQLSLEIQRVYGELQALFQ